MRHPSEWFATKPDIDEDTSRPTRFWHWNREWFRGYGPDYRWRLTVGDIVADMEHDTGEPAGAQFGVDVRLWEDIGQFDEDSADQWHDHSVSAILWRWGVYFAWRGSRKDWTPFDGSGKLRLTYATDPWWKRAWAQFRGHGVWTVTGALQDGDS